ncbi:uncharacterized protein PRCAT00003373001 [Priceomyces carsonii]|uniref:uncharacterized protein n=1 Tax=Priceomyces carsonii TaxID=28549 RepID=UPI002ED92F3E|nr:unnamed protein product [Priceomyces carsonii]
MEQLNHNLTDDPTFDEFLDTRNGSSRGNFLYTHSNNSSSTTVHYPHPTSTALQISSVGFNNLKKMSTNNSQISTASSVVKINPLTKLFTRSQDINQGSDDSSSATYNEDDSSSDLITIELKKSSGPNKFKLSKGTKNKLKFSTKNGQTKPDLRIQTGSSLRAPRKIFSTSGQPSDSPETPTSTTRKSSISSPVSTFHSLFHRSRSLSQSSGDGNSPKRNQDEINLQKIANNNRNTLTLSSNSSNSYITDVKLAMIYNFTSPGYSVELSDSMGVDHNSLGDIHKKLMVPTDQYVLNKLHKNLSQVTGLGIVNGGSEHMLDFGKENAKFYNNLLHILRPMFYPKHNRKLPYGSQHPYLGMTIEEISNYIKRYQIDEKHIRQTLLQNALKKTRSRLSNALSKAPNSKSSSSLTLEDTVDNDLKFRETSQDLLSFFTRCMVWLLESFKMHDSSEIGPLSQITREWMKVASLWEYFNQKVRFNIICMFHPFQVYLRKLSIDTKQRTGIEIENIMLLAFRDTVLMPWLFERRKLFSKETLRDIKSTDLSDSIKDLKTEEEAILKSSQSQLLRTLISCFGTVYSYAQADSGNSDGEQHLRDRLFDETFTRLTNIY